ncbi:cold shock domain-containing protein [Streptomyces sp. SID8379]|uniref:cold-shock protein n=1 Tax=unclassified Streptomyces TaxID=2593676 RepID=UPI0004771638|nr:cold shock domain-containing protein [Streptomyces sp. HmicA12]MYW66787.1 cold shock domain-containing protein [Streptomyces sp. SID8379]
MVAGRVVRFDGARGYGFIAPDDGGEDVFLHVNDLLIPESYLRTGLKVEFDIEDGDRGPKASSVQLAEGASAPVAGGRSVAADGDDVLCDVLRVDEFTNEVTELLLRAAPSITGEQILAIRRELVQSGRKHGWVDS